MYKKGKTKIDIVISIHTLCSNFSWSYLRCFYTLIGHLWSIPFIGCDLERHIPVYIRSHSWLCISEQKPKGQKVKRTACRAQRQDCVQAQIWGRLLKGLGKRGDQQLNGHSGWAPEILCGDGKNLQKDNHHCNTTDLGFRVERPDRNLSSARDTGKPVWSLHKGT